MQLLSDQVMVVSKSSWNVIQRAASSKISISSGAVSGILPDQWWKGILGRCIILKNMAFNNMVCVSAVGALYKDTRIHRETIPTACSIVVFIHRVYSACGEGHLLQRESNMCQARLVLAGLPNELALGLAGQQQQAWQMSHHEQSNSGHATLAGTRLQDRESMQNLLMTASNSTNLKKCAKAIQNSPQECKMMVALEGQKLLTRRMTH